MKRFLICIILLSLGATAAARTHRFEPSDAGRLGSAFEQLQSGDRVVLESGRYPLRRGLVLNGVEGVTIEGHGRVELVLEQLEEPVLSLVRCRRIEISNLRARHRQPAHEYVCEGAVINLNNSKKVKIWDCHLNGCGAAGVFAMGSDEVVIMRNRIFNNTYAGVWLQNSHAHVLHNKIYDNAASLITYGDCRVTMLGNEIKDNVGNDYTGAYEIERWFEE